MDTLRHAGVEHAKLVVSSITDDVLRGTNNIKLMKNVRANAPDARIVLTTDHIPQALEFYAAGADFVFIPRLYSAAACARILRRGLTEGFEEFRKQAIGHLSQRQEVLA
jgi:Trk K+ transport system NAD-binding subunit